MASSRLAKLSPPRASNWLARRRLNRLIDHATKNGVAWIAAEPGAGKSTLAAAWSSSRTGRLLWYRVDEGDTDPGVAFAYFRELARSGRRAGALPAYRPRDVERLDLFSRSLHQRFLRRTHDRGLAMERAGELEQALILYEAALSQDPLAEHLYQGAIRCHLAAGRAADALRAYRRCREQLSIVLGVPPSAATSKLVARISAG